MTRPHYDLNQLITDVTALLADKGITTNLEPSLEGRRQQGATDLLAGLGITPTLAPEAALDLDGHARYNRMVHGD